MRYLFLVIFHSGFFYQVVSQENSKPTSDYQWAIRMNPLGLADFMDHNINLGAEYRFHKNWSVSTDLSYVFYSKFYNQSKGASGYIVKPAIRYYASTRSRLFLEWDIFYKHVGYKMEDWLGKDCVNEVPSYDMYTSFIIQKKVAGTNLKIGRQLNLSENKRLKLEIYLGLGFRHRWSGIKNDPKACFTNGGVFSADFMNGPITVPSFPAGIRFVYTFFEP